MTTLHIVGIGGTTRPNSSTERALRHALAACEQQGATTSLFAGAELEALPHYAPENPTRTEGARHLVDEIRRADGIIIASPGYHGSVAGIVKNAIDYTEDLREEERCYLSGRAVGLIATGAGWQGVVTTLEALRSIVHALRGWPTPMGVAINSTQCAFGPDGQVTDEKVAFQLETMAGEVMEFVKVRQAGFQPAG